MSDTGVIFDQLSLERAVIALSKSRIRSLPLTVDRIKQWVKQFETNEEKLLAWLILRHLIFRTSEQLQSSLRQALKHAAQHFINSALLGDQIEWRDALAGKHPGLTFYCGPPLLEAHVQPGKSGELITRLVYRNFGLQKYYPRDVKVLEADERYLLVDDGTYTGVQLCDFLEAWRDDYAENRRIALVVAIAHECAVAQVSTRFPSVPIFYGELLATKHCFDSWCEQWVRTGVWNATGSTPSQVYLEIFNRMGPFEHGHQPSGFGSLGALVAYEHGIPDDSLQLLWDRSAKWTPLIER